MVATPPACRPGSSAVLGASVAEDGAAATTDTSKLLYPSPRGGRGRALDVGQNAQRNIAIGSRSRSIRLARTSDRLGEPQSQTARTRFSALGRLQTAMAPEWPAGRPDTHDVNRHARAAIRRRPATTPLRPAIKSPRRLSGSSSSRTAPHPVQQLSPSTAFLDVGCLVGSFFEPNGSFTR